jgi:hypothetical protein
MPHTLSRGLIVGSLVAVAACGSARLIQRTPTSGIFELEGERGKAMEQANQQMALHCGPNNFTIMEEGEETIGTTTRAQTAWRVHYQCGGGEGPGGPPPGTEPPPPPAAPPPPPAPPATGW